MVGVLHVLFEFSPTLSRSLFLILSLLLSLTLFYSLLLSLTLSLSLSLSPFLSFVILFLFRSLSLCHTRDLFSLQNGPLDTTHFHANFTSLRVEDSPVDYHLSPSTQHHFAGFSFTRSPLVLPMAAPAAIPVAARVATTTATDVLVLQDM